MALLSDGKPVQEVERYLSGISFPALKHDVVHHARHAQAPADVVSMLESIPITEFQSMQQVLSAYGELR